MTTVSDSVAAPDQPAELPPGFARLAAIMMTGVVAVFLDTTVVNVAINTLSSHFGSAVATAQWSVSGYVLAMGMVIPLAGWLLGRVGAKPAWMSALALFALGSLLCSLAPDIGALIAFRVVQGVGGGLMLPIMQAVLIRAAGPRPSNRAVAAVALPAVLGPILGPVLGGVIIQYLDWRAVFWVNLPLCAAGLIMAWRGLENTDPAEAAPLDVVGLVLLSPALAAILYGLTEAGIHRGFTAAVALYPLFGGVILLGGFVAYALRAARPLVGLRPFRTRSFSASTLVLLLAGLSVYGAMLLLPLYFLQVQHLSILAAGLCLVPQGLGTLVSRVATAKLADRVGPRPVVFCGIVVAATATVPFAFAGPHTSLAFLALVLVVRGLGLGAVTIIVMASAYRDLDRSLIPDATAGIRIGQQVGNAFGTTVLAMLLESGLSGDTGRDPVPTAFHHAFWWSIGLSAVTALPALALPRGGLTSIPPRSTQPGLATSGATPAR